MNLFGLARNAGIFYQVGSAVAIIGVIWQLSIGLPWVDARWGWLGDVIYLMFGWFFFPAVAWIVDGAPPTTLLIACAVTYLAPVPFLILGAALSNRS